MHKCIQYVWSPQNGNCWLGQDIWGGDFFSKAEKWFNLPKCTRTTLPPKVNVECWGAFCCNRAVPFISMIVLPCLFNVCRTEHLWPVPASRLDMHVAGGTWLWTILCQDFWFWVKEAELKCTCRGSGKWADKQTLVFISSVKSSSHLA